VPLPAALPLLDLNAPQQIVEFIISRFRLGGRDRTEAAMPGAIAPKAGSGG
jgi:hypothetical protein